MKTLSRVQYRSLCQVWDICLGNQLQKGNKIIVSKGYYLIGYSCIVVWAGWEKWFVVCIRVERVWWGGSPTGPLSVTKPEN